MLNFFHLLSLDVVLGAVFTSLIFWKLPDGNQKIDLASVLLLGITTWVIYILDRLLDLKIYPENFSERHQFHSKNQYNLSVFLVLLCLVGLVLCFFIPRVVFFYGLGISVVLISYFILLNKLLKNKSLQWIKEPVTAISYVAAVVGIAFVTKKSINLSEWVLALMLFLVASQNLILFSYFESLAHKEVDNTVSFFGRKRSLKLIRIIGFIVVFLTVFLFSQEWGFMNKAAFLFALMAQILSFLPVKEELFLENDRYRWMGDGVFLLSIILVFF